MYPSIDLDISSPSSLPSCLSTRETHLDVPLSQDISFDFCGNMTIVMILVMKNKTYTGLNGASNDLPAV